MQQIASFYWFFENAQSKKKNNKKQHVKNVQLIYMKISKSILWLMIYNHQRTIRWLQPILKTLIRTTTKTIFTYVYHKLWFNSAKVHRPLFSAILLLKNDLWRPLSQNKNKKKNKRKLWKMQDDQKAGSNIMQQQPAQNCAKNIHKTIMIIISNSLPCPIKYIVALFLFFFSSLGQNTKNVVWFFSFFSFKFFSSFVCFFSCSEP